MAPLTNEIVVLSGNTHPQLADTICSRLGLKKSNITIFRAANRETLITLPDSVRSRDVYIIQSATNTNVNDAIMEMLLMGYTCKTSAAKSIVGILPYLPYGKQTKQRKRGSIPSKLVAKLIGGAGFTHIVTVDLHHKEIQGFFDIPVENLRASPFLISHLQQTMFENSIDRSQVVIVARHTSAMKRATAYAQRLRADIAVLHGSSEAETDAMDGRSSPPPVRDIEFMPGGDTLPMFTDHEAFRAQPLNLVGDVRDKVAVIVEDIIDDVDAFILAARFLKDQGAQKVFLVGTHALFSEAQGAVLNASSAIEEIIVTDSVPNEFKFDKIKAIDIAVLLTEAIRRLHNQESLSYLFTDVSVED